MKLDSSHLCEDCLLVRYIPLAIPYLLLLIQIRLVSIHGQDIRILSMYFTQEYYQSFQKATQSTSGNLDIRIESFRLPDDWEPQTEIKKLAKPSTWLQKQMKTSDNGMIGDLDGGVCSSNHGCDVVPQ
jgi:hypothetical protein